MESPSDSVEPREVPQPTRYPHQDELRKLVAFIKPITFRDHDFYATVFQVLGAQSPLLIVITGFGVATNVINLMVFKRQGIMTDSCTVYFTGLAITGFSLCLLDFLSGILTWILIVADTNEAETAFMTFNGFSIKPGSTRYIEPMTNIFKIPTLILTEYEGWVTTCLTIERMVSVTFPFVVKRIFTAKRSCIILFVLFVIQLGLRMPRILGNKIVLVEMEGSADGVYHIDWQLTDLVPTGITNAFTMVVVSVLGPVCIITIVLCNGIIVAKVNISRRFRTSKLPTAQENKSNLKSSTSCQGDAGPPKNGPNTIIDAKSKREAILIRTMYVLSFTFLASRMPEIVLGIVYHIQTNISHFWQYSGAIMTWGFYATFHYVGITMIRTNAATIIFIHYALSRKYRDVFGEIFPFCNKCKCKRN